MTKKQVRKHCRKCNTELDGGVYQMTEKDNTWMLNPESVANWYCQVLTGKTLQETEPKKFRETLVRVTTNIFAFGKEVPK